MNDNEMLSFIAKNAEMGIVGIDSVSQYSQSRNFLNELSNQKNEYEKIYKSASNMISKRGSEPARVSSVAKMSADMMAKIKTMTDRTDSKIAEMMIEGSTMGVTKIIKHKREYDGGDERVNDLADKLLKTEENNIVNMKRFL